jgi:ATP-dependent DNA helicase RecG
MLAPTEILAEQHFKNAQKWLTPLGISVAQLSQSSEDKKELQEKIAKGEVSVVIGTHAIFQKSVAFSKLALVIVDEQHRFGVEQRNELLKKNKAFVPHLLMMTATPIPRSMALTLYGDLDLTTIRQKPAGRSKVRTWVMLDRDRPKVYTRMREKVQNGEQVFIIYPLVDVSEKLVDLKSATEMHQKLQKEIFPEFKIALLHGKLKSEEKDKILSDFRDKKYQILVSTTVIEVGIDIPNATLMVVEHPERLGLSQLHQLRGRVGRGALQSDCVLLAEKSKTERLRVMEKTDDGFEIAEADLKIRGPGEFLGLRQSGLPGFRIGEVIRDAELLSWAREEANRILESDPELKLPEYAAISKMVESRWKQKIERLRGG